MRLLIDSATIAAHEAEEIQWLDRERYGIALVDGVRVRYHLGDDETMNYNSFPDTAFIYKEDLALIKPTGEAQRAAIIKAQDSGRKFKLKTLTPPELRAKHPGSLVMAYQKLHVLPREVKEFGLIHYTDNGEIDIFGYR